MFKKKKSRYSEPLTQFGIPGNTAQIVFLMLAKAKVISEKQLNQLLKMNEHIGPMRYWDQVKEYLDET